MVNNRHAPFFCFATVSWRTFCTLLLFSSMIARVAIHHSWYIGNGTQFVSNVGAGAPQLTGRTYDVSDNDWDRRHKQILHWQQNISSCIHCGKIEDRVTTVTRVALQACSMLSCLLIKHFVVHSLRSLKWMWIVKTKKISSLWLVLVTSQDQILRAVSPHNW